VIALRPYQQAAIDRICSAQINGRVRMLALPSRREVHHQTCRPRIYIRRPSLLIAGIESPARSALVRALGSLAQTLRAVRRGS
jgi:hypothetical protein